MPLNELRQEIAFGLENLVGVYQNIVRFSSLVSDESLQASALTYECLGYYNAVEHLVIRILKHLGQEIPSGTFSHRDTLKAFHQVVNMRMAADESTFIALENLMAFRHVATKIYGFLIDRDKLEVVVTDIRRFHPGIVDLFQTLLTRLED